MCLRVHVKSMDVLCVLFAWINVCCLYYVQKIARRIESNVFTFAVFQNYERKWFEWHIQHGLIDASRKNGGGTKKLRKNREKEKFCPHNSKFKY